jgi:FkbH-like protein
MSKPVADKKGRKIKCVVWDLDNTLWNGVLLEDNQVSLRQEVVDIIKTLDSRGILHSIASKNNYEMAIARVKEFGLKDYFLYPQIHWDSKVSSLKNIAKSINIGIDTLALIDDQLFELEEVKFSLPEVLCINVADIGRILDMPEMKPRFITHDSKKRRLMYLSDIERNKIEDSFAGTQEEFLASLNMSFSIFPATEEDLKRAEELTVRTHQLNTTGYTYSYEELNNFRQSNDHLLLMASLDDRYGTYGKIGLALIKLEPKVWRIKLLLMSCRVISRGVGSIMLNRIMAAAKKAGVHLEAEFVPTEVNRMMYVTYKFANFKEKEKNDNHWLLNNDLTYIPNDPNYVNIQAEIMSGRPGRRSRR